MPRRRASACERLVRVGGEHRGGAGFDHQRRDAEPRGAEADLADGHGAELGPDLVAGDKRRGDGCDRRAVDVVVHHRDVERVLQAGLDLEAVGDPDVLEVDRAEAGRDRRHGGDELVDVLGGDEDRDRGDPDHLAVEHRLALHHGHRGDGADVAEPEHPGAVGADGDGAADRRVAVGERGLVGDHRADARDARRVRVAHVLEGAHPVRDLDVQLAALVGAHGPVVVVDDAHAVELAEHARDRLRLAVVRDLDRELADRAVVGRPTPW